MCFLPGLKLDFKEPASKRQRGENKENAVPEKPKKGKKRPLPSFLPLVSSDGPKASEVPRAARGVRGAWPCGGLHDRGRTQRQRRGEKGARMTLTRTPSIHKDHRPVYNIHRVVGYIEPHGSSILQLLDLQAARTLVLQAWKRWRNWRDPKHLGGA